MSYPIEASTCPYCHTHLAKVPTRKSKCPHCREMIFPRTIAVSKARVLATAHEAEEIEKENAEIYLERDWKRFLSSYQITDKDFEKERLGLKKNFGCTPKTSDVIWGLLQGITNEAVKSGDFHRLKMAYLNQKRFLLDEGGDASKVTIEALKCEIYEGLQNFDNPQFQVMACGESCEHCKGYDGKIVDGKSAFGLIEEIVNGCTDARGCRCCLTVWRERWKDVLEDNKTFQSRGKGSQLKKCPSCGEGIVEGSINCTLCGATKISLKNSSDKTSTVAWLGCAFFILFFGFLGLILFRSNNGKSDSKVSNTKSSKNVALDSKADDIMACEELIKKNAQFPSSVNTHVFMGSGATTLGNGAKLVRLDFDAKNGFGNELPYTAFCSKIPGEPWIIRIENR